MLVAFRESVAAALRAALADADFPTDDLGLEDPPEGVDAVLASSVAFRLASEAGAPPPKIAAELAESIDAANFEYIDQVATSGPYVNFTPDESYFSETLQAALRPEYGTRPPRDTSVVVEHTSANPTGPVHVGRARNPIIGDAVANLLEYAGYDVDRHYYVNDAGRQMAVFTWAYERFDESDLDEEVARDRTEYDLVRYYRRGNAFLQDAPEEEAAAAEAEIEQIMQGLEANEEDTLERVAEVVDQVLGGMQDCLARLPAEFDEFVKESRFMRDGSTDELATRLQNTEYAVYQEDAWQLELDDWGIDKNLVFLRSDGTSLYTTRDLAHHEWKFTEYDRAVTVLGEDHKLQAEQLRATLDILGADPSQLDNVIYSYVNLPDGRMSTREGTGVQLDDLLDEAIARARDEVESRLGDRIRDDQLSDADIERISHQVGIGAVRYDIVAKQPAKAITFDWEEALDFEAQSAPYVQYVHARCCGILAETDEQLADGVSTTTLSAPEERRLLREIARFPAVVETAAEDLRPHTVATYTRNLAEAFNAFYRECSVLSADGQTRQARIALVAGARHTVANALDILGVQAPDSM